MGGRPGGPIHRMDGVEMSATYVSRAAADLYHVMGDAAEDVLEELWPQCRPDYWEFLDHCTSEELEAWQAPFFREVMAELAALCAWRAQLGAP